MSETASAPALRGPCPRRPEPRTPGRAGRLLQGHRTDRGGDHFHCGFECLRTSVFDARGGLDQGARRGRWEARGSMSITLPVLAAARPARLWPVPV